MIADGARREELREFLRAARLRVEPAEAGLAAGPNRRSRGLYQADVATALQMSTRWYTAFENGSGQGSRAPAPDILDRLAEVLQLTAAERVRLYLLAAGHEPAHGTLVGSGAADDESRAALERLVRMTGPDLPCMLCDVAWNILTWNKALADRIFDPSALSPADRNLILWLFTADAARTIADIGAVRGEEIGQVHLALARSPNDKPLGDLAARLRQLPAARRVWQRQHVPRRTLISPRRIRPNGSARSTRSDLVSAEFGRLRLLIVVPHGNWSGRRPHGRAHLNDGTSRGREDVATRAAEALGQGAAT